MFVTGSREEIISNLPFFTPSLPSFLSVSALQIPIDERVEIDKNGKQSINEMMNDGGRRNWHGGWNGWGWTKGIH